MAQIATKQQQIVWALHALAPGAEWGLNSQTDTSGLIWIDKVIPQPTDAALAAWIVANPNGPPPIPGPVEVYLAALHTWAMAVGAKIPSLAAAPPAPPAGLNGL